MLTWRNLAGKWVLMAAFVLPGLLCLLPWLSPSLSLRPRSRYVAFYIAPFFLGFLLWIRRRILDSWASFDARLVLDIVVVVCSALRLAGPVIPPSGHMLFFVYSFLTTTSFGYRAVTSILIVETTFIKLVVWHDRMSWAFGVLAGLALGVLYFVLQGRPVHRCDPPTA